MTEPGSPATTWLTRLTPVAWILPVAGLLLAHLPGLGRAWSGDHYFGCDGFQDRCDTLYTLKLARGAWLHMVDAWDAVDGPLDALGFLLQDLWSLAIQARVLNLLDLLVWVFPLRASLPVGPAMVFMNLGLLLAAVVSGVIYAWALGCGPIGRAAAGLTVGTAGVVLHSAAHGQYAQAMIAPCLLVLAGLVRLWRGQRWGLFLTAGALAISLTLYWLNALLLGFAGALLLSTALAVRWPRARSLPLALLLVVVITLVLVLPAALPVMDGIFTGAETKLRMDGWGDPYLLPGDPGFMDRGHSAFAVLDEVAWWELLSPRSGWLLPALPLLPATVLAALSKRALPWVALVALGVLMMLGPLPQIPEWLSGGLGGTVHELYGEAPRIQNHLYTLYHQWVPGASRMHHALRWGLLVAAGVATLTALGMDRVAAARPRLAWGLLAAGVLWAATVGPWPLSLAVFPGVAERTLAQCSELWLVPIEPEHEDPTRNADEAALLDGVTWKSALPIIYDVFSGWPPPTPADEATGERIRASMDAILTGYPPPAPVPPGACVLMDAGISALPPELVDSRLRAFGAQHEPLEIPARSFHRQGEPRRWDLYRLGTTDTP